MAQFKGYQRIIHEMDATVDPRGVEASMRMIYGTLGGIGRDVFKAEIEKFKACEAAVPGWGASIADSMGIS